ncbi:MAG: defective in exine formation DEX1, partial [Trebouxia sp. A1-2]
ACSRLPFIFALAPFVHLRTVLGFDCTSDQISCHRRCRCSVNGMQVLKAVVLALLCSSIVAQLSDPIAGDHQVKSHKNKFLKRAATQDENRLLSDEEPGDSLCPQNVQLKWTTEVSSSIYATPTITDLYSDAHKDIIVPAFVNQLEVLDGADGARATDWEGQHQSALHTSALLFDIDFDGIQDILVATYDGDVLAFKDTGEALSLAHSFFVPPLKVRKDWYEGLNPDPTDHSHPDVGNIADAQALEDNEDLRDLSKRVQFRGTQQQQQQQQTATQANDTNSQQNSARRHLLADAYQDADAVYDDYLLDDAPSLHGDYDEVRTEHGWEVDSFFRPPRVPDKGHVWLDPHILANPAIADIDGDGQEELVIAVSYFFDRDQYSRPGRAKTLPKDVDISQYVGGGIVVFNLRSRNLRWQQHLDLSTDHTKYRAYMYSAPTLVDLNRDGKMEIVVGTSMGFLYVLDCEGRSVAGWPLQMGDIQAQVAVGDINGDGFVEVVAADANGNVAAFNAKADELWERHVASLVAQAVTFGDVNGDGCADTMDIGEQSYSMVLTDDLDNNGHMDLLVSTMNGNVYALETSAVYHPMKAWTSVVHGVNCFTARWNWQGIAATADTRAPRDVAGQRLKIRFEIVDRRFGVLAGPVKEGEVDPNRVQRGPYTVYLTLQGMTAAVIGRGEAPVIGMTDSYTLPGVYTLEVPCPTTRSTGTIHLEMWDEDKLSFVHDFSLSFHMQYAKLLKWLVALPFTIMAAVIINVLSNRDKWSSTSLPMFQSDALRPDRTK